MRKVIGIGETILDIIFRNNRPHTAVPGGSTFNGLISLGRLGVPVSFISEVGNDHVGDIIRDFMKEKTFPPATSTVSRMAKARFRSRSWTTTAMPTTLSTRIIRSNASTCPCRRSTKTTSSSTAPITH